MDFYYQLEEGKDTALSLSVSLIGQKETNVIWSTKKDSNGTWIRQQLTLGVSAEESVGFWHVFWIIFDDGAIIMSIFLQLSIHPVTCKMYCESDYRECIYYVICRSLGMAIALTQ